MQGGRKYLSEFAVGLCSAGWIMVPSNQLCGNNTMQAEWKSISDRCHIYLICQHPAASFEPDAFTCNDGYIEGNIIYRVDGAPHKLHFRREYPLLDGSVDVRPSPYPHRELHSIDKNGKTLGYLPANAICFRDAPVNDENIRHFKVLYVGQAYGDGTRSALERLRSHPTLQHILAEASYHSPDSEIFLMMFEYAPYTVFALLDGTAKNAIRDNRNMERFFSIMNNPLTEAQQICLAEAALIRYFSPHYNKIYKDGFPSPHYKMLQQCYALDFSALVVEIDTEENLFRLYSDAASPRLHHFCNIDLFGHTERMGFFNLSEGDASLLLVPDVIR